VAIGLLAVDLDGTVLGPGKEIAPGARAALQAAERAGVAVVLATGRMLRSARAVQEQLGLHGPLITYNGGLVSLPDGRGWVDPVPLETARAIGELCRRRGFFLQCYLGDDLYVPFADGRAEAYAALASVPYTVAPDLVYAPPSPPTKLLVIEPAERQPEVRAALQPLAAGRCELANSYPHYLEISRLGVHKGSALARLAATLGIPPAAVMAVGDGENDLPMLRYAAVRVAVANAAPVLREAADYVARARFGDGVAEAVQRFVLRAAG
jgi:Cof subfamily protein (haloacid dehalogenase superfamily)